MIQVLVGIKFHATLFICIFFQRDLQKFDSLLFSPSDCRTWYASLQLAHFVSRSEDKSKEKHYKKGWQREISPWLPEFRDNERMKGMHATEGKSFACSGGQDPRRKKSFQFKWNKTAKIMFTKLIWIINLIHLEISTIVRQFIRIVFPVETLSIIKTASATIVRFAQNCASGVV